MGRAEVERVFRQTNMKQHLSNLLLDVIKVHEKAFGKNYFRSDLFIKSLHYCQRFSAFSRKDSVEQASKLLSSWRFSDGSFLTKIEIASLCNMLPRDSEEAKTIIKSLARAPEEELEELLTELNGSFAVIE